MSSVSFVTKYSNSFYKLELSKTLLHFVEYDFTYFWEQAISLGKYSRRQNEYPYDQSNILRGVITRCHPYYESLINFDFDAIVIDCIIEYICRNENIGLESLWASCISPKSSYEKAIFARISEYKTNRAINQWVNLVRIQEYAKTKLAFIFDGEPCTLEEAQTRCSYFDLAYSVTAKEIGYPADELAAVKRFSLTQMPNAVFMIKKASKDIYKRLNDKLEKVPEPTKNQTNDILRDSYALDAFDYIKDITRPPEFEMFAAMDSFKLMPKTVYLPNCFKAIIDLEFELMLENGLLFQKCEVCGRYFNRNANYNGKLCDRVKSSGLNCREEAEQGKQMALEISDELDKKTRQVYSSLYRKVGKAIDEAEFKEWSQYLSGLKKNIKSEYSTTDELEAFLEYTERMYGEVKQTTHLNDEPKQL